jgi:hypothetical protein
MSRYKENSQWKKVSTLNTRTADWALSRKRKKIETETHWQKEPIKRCAQSKGRLDTMCPLLREDKDVWTMWGTNKQAS